MIVSPTMKLRWVQKRIDASMYNDVMKTVYIEGADTHFVLQQYWKDDEGNGEWRDIEIEWNPEITK